MARQAPVWASADLHPAGGIEYDRAMLAKLALLSSLLGLAACGSDSLTGLQGVYTVTTWTQNSQGCEAEGSSVKDFHEPFLYVKSEKFIGTKFVNVVSCQDVAECHMMADDSDTLHLGGFSFEKGSDSGGWTTHSAFGFGEPDMCDGFVSDTTMTSAADTIRVEQRTVDVTYGGQCTDEAAEAAAAGQPCGELEVMTATFTEDL